MRCSGPKCFCRQSCTPFSHSGKWWMSISGMSFQHDEKSLNSTSVCVGRHLANLAASKRSALITVASYMQTSSTFSKSRFWMKARTASAIVNMYRLCDGSHCSMHSRYLSTAQRLMHSSISWESSVA